MCSLCCGSRSNEEEGPRHIPFGTAGKEDAEEYPNNEIKTSKYTVYNFLCKNLFEQLQRFMNVWFLFLGSLMCLGLYRAEIDGRLVPIFPAVVPPWGTLCGLLPMMMISAVMAAIDDIRRHRADGQENGKTIYCLKGDMFEEKICQEIKVGDIILIADKQEFPADVVALVSAGDEGGCYVSTANLDGETNLKAKSAVQCTQELCPEHSEQGDYVGKLNSISGVVVAEAPSQDIHNFQGNISLEARAAQPLDGRNLLLRGTMLKNTPWCIGLVVYTGRQTRMMMNSRPVPSKVATLEFAMNVITAIMIGFQCILAVVSTIGVLMVRPSLAKLFYLSPLEEYVFPDWFGQWLGFFLLYSNLVPVSCFATVETCNFLQAYFINNDIEMLDKETDTPARCRATNLCHELGQVSYIFSDKTGTLTQNVMELKQLCMCGTYYGSLDSPEKGFQGGEKFDADRRGANKELIEAFLEVLGVAHTVIVSPSGSYEAESPEEGTMVEAAARYGYELKARSGNTMTLDVGPKGQARSSTYEVLGINTFNSDRKRMSLVVRKDDGQHLLLIKGADNVMMERATKPDPKLMEQLSDCSRKGLRCLVVGRRKLNDSEVRAWQQEHQAAEASMSDRETLLARSAEKIEKNIEILGATAIEDKLQDNVGETIQMIRWAGVKLWVLTGDKLETARNIGFSTNVLSDSMLILKLEAGEELSDCVSQATLETKRQVALLVTGKALSDIKDSETDETFLELGKMCRVVIACRVSPSQKASIVSLVRDGVKPKPVTLCIGDGANDVPMIQEAHVGVGIFGREGRQAVNNSDFAIAQFRYLQYLLFWHGRWNYLRVAKVILYSFWRNGVLVVSMFFYSTAAGWSGTSLYEDLVRGTFNIATGPTSVCLGIFDRDLDKADSLSLYAFREAQDSFYDEVEAGDMKIPKGGILQYKRGIKGEELNLWKAVETVLSAFFHSSLLYANMRACYPGFDMHQAGDLWTFGTAVFICLILDVMYRAILITRSWNWAIIISAVGCTVIFILFIIVYGLFGYMKFNYTLQMYMVWKHIFGTGIFYICLITVPFVAMSVDTFKQYIFDQLLYPYVFSDQEEIQKTEGEVLHPGANVTIHGMLEDWAPYNWQEGRCISYDEGSEFWTVQLNSGESLDVKSENLAMEVEGIVQHGDVLSQDPQHVAFDFNHVENRSHRPAHKIKDMNPRRAKNDFNLNVETSSAQVKGMNAAENYTPLRKSETDDDEESSAINPSPFAQQDMCSKPNLLWIRPCCCASSSLVSSALLFTLVAAWGWLETERTYQLRIPYDGQPANRWWDTSDEYEAKPCPAGVNAVCDYALTLKQDMAAPITAYYIIDPFYQNYFDYYASVSWKELIGQEDSSKRCSKETSETQDGHPIFPCGLQAKSFFNDTYEVLGISSAGSENIEAGSTSILDESGVAWESDLKRFANPDGYPDPESTLWLYERFPEIINKEQGAKNAHFAAWMRLDAFTEVRKHYGQIDRDLKKGDTLHIRIKPRFPLPEGARKEFVLTTLNVFGGRNNAFAWFFFVAGCLTIVMAVCVCALDGVVLPACRRARFNASYDSDDDDEDTDT